MSIDPFKVGQQQAQVQLDALKKAGKATPRVVMINGSPTDSNAPPYKEGAKRADKAGAKIVKSYDTPDWSPDKAQQEMEQTITALGNNGFDAVYVANDGMAGGAIAAMKAAGIDPSKLFVTGQDAEVAGIQRILAGEQLMTVYQPIKEIADDVGRDRRAAGPGQAAAGASPRARPTTAAARCRRCCCRPSRSPRTTSRHGGQGRLPEGRRHLHRPVREGLRGRRHPVSTHAPLPRSACRAPAPRASSCASILRGLIDTLKPGDPLPSERELAERYGVARMTVRAEITRLAAEGLVAARAGARHVRGRGRASRRPRRSAPSRRTCAPAA